MGCESANENRHLQKNHNQKKNITLSDTEKATLECKSCRDKIKKYIRNLEQKENKSREKAKELLRKKQRDRAKSYLKQAKLFREQVSVADGQLDMINEQIVRIESTCNMGECMACLKHGNNVLKKLQSEVNIEHWDNIRERGIDEEEYEAECEEELNKLLFEIQGGNELPSVPQTKINDDRIKVSQNKVKKRVLA